MAAPYSACRSYPSIASVSLAQSPSAHGGQQLYTERMGKNQQYFQHFQLKSCHGREKKRWNL